MGFGQSSSPVLPPTHPPKGPAAGFEDNAAAEPAAELLPREQLHAPQRTELPSLFCSLFQHGRKAKEQWRYYTVFGLCLVRMAEAIFILNLGYPKSPWGP